MAAHANQQGGGDGREFDAAHDAAPERQAKVNVGQKIRMQAPPSSEMLLRNPASLAALLGLSANAPAPSPNEVSLPPNHELLALIEPADGIPPASDDEDWDDDEEGDDEYDDDEYDDDDD